MRPSKTPTKGVLRDEILVVDDVADNRLLLRALLEQDRYTIREAQDGLEALAMIAARAPDLVLLDVSMPRMDGFEVLSRLRASEARDVPVMLLTAAASEPEAVERGIALGAIEYVKKPIDGAELRARVRGVLRVEKLRRDMAALRRDHEAMMVHDLRHPVGKLSLIAELLEGEEEITPAQRQSYAHTIRGLCDEMTRLVDGVLQAARIDAGLFRIERRATDLAVLLEAEAGPFVAVAARRNQTLAVDVGAAGTLSVDGPTLAQAVQNLLANAVKFTPRGGRIALSAQRREGGVEIVLDDSGPGIAPEQAAQIFDRYHQAPTNRARGGAGLGLAIVRAVAESHGGTARVEASPLGGARFVIALPAR